MDGHHMECTVDEVKQRMVQQVPQGFKFEMEEMEDQNI